MKIIQLLAAASLAMVLAACGGGGGSGGTPLTGTTSTTTTTTTATTTSSNSNASVATILVVPSGTSVPANSTTSLSISVYALDVNNALVSNAVLNIAGTNNVILSSSSVVTNLNGAGSISLYGNSSNQSSRVSVVTVSCSGCAAAPVTTNITVVGASLTVTSAASNLVVGGASTTLSATVKSVAGAGISGTPVTFGVTDSTVLAVSAPTVITNSSGVATVTVSGIGSGSASVNVAALGNAVAQSYSVGVSGSSLAFTSPANNSLMTTNLGQVISVSAPGASSVIFASTIGTFGNGLSNQTVAVSGVGVASATLTSSQAGLASISATDNLSRQAGLSLSVSPPVSSANKIILNATSTTLPLSSAGNQASVIITASASYYNGTSSQPVANVPIAFHMTGGPGAGEYLSPPLAYTNTAGNATATFYSGTGASISNGISIAAAIQGTSVSTGVAPSSNNLLMTIGGQALSVAFGQASVLQASSDNTLYLQSYSVQVTDANNNPVQNAVVTLRVRPVAFSLGSPCNVTATYCSEDLNGNGSLDPAEDGARTSLPNSLSVTACPITPAFTNGTLDGLLTPQNSAGGSVPSTVTTDVTGIAAFTLTYLKADALWIVDKLTATVSSNGTESSSSSTFRLPATTTDAGSTCLLPASPYVY